MDVSRSLHSKIWIGNGERGFFQPVLYEKLPVYCTFCSRFGHNKSACLRHEKTTDSEPMMPKKLRLLPRLPLYLLICLLLVMLRFVQQLLMPPLLSDSIVDVNARVIAACATLDYVERGLSCNRILLGRFVS
ncbi:unnamed protein product [Cuscuta europaea]|uniref:DUF4283 domain-containing protein n=1 Tax=Cuscuta europaea TaxID=41803 RepID=A0A9P1EAS4_CUSEU|nr:unnamed protein product [Cuscuta europaea]